MVDHLHVAHAWGGGCGGVMASNLDRAQHLLNFTSMAMTNLSEIIFWFIRQASVGGVVSLQCEGGMKIVDQDGSLTNNQVSLTCGADGLFYNNGTVLSADNKVKGCYKGTEYTYLHRPKDVLWHTANDNFSLWISSVLIFKMINGYDGLRH